MKEVNILFDELWPGMAYVDVHKETCIRSILSIQNAFRKYSDDHNSLFSVLKGMDGIGITIASGLIWAKYPRNRVPFDKYTTAYALQKKILKTERISDDYVSACKKVSVFCSKFPTRGKKYRIIDFVREARMECEFEIEPK